MDKISAYKQVTNKAKKDIDNENDRVNGLRMNKEMTMKEKRKADTHLAHCLLPDTQANASQKSKSQIFPT